MKQTQELIKIIGLKSDKQLDQLLKLIKMIDNTKEFHTFDEIDKQVLTYSKTK